VKKIVKPALATQIKPKKAVKAKSMPSMDMQESAQAKGKKPMGRKSPKGC